MMLEESLARLIARNQAARARTWQINQEFGRAFSFGTDSDWTAVYDKYFGPAEKIEVEGDYATGRVADSLSSGESPAHAVGDGPGAEAGIDGGSAGS